MIANKIRSLIGEQGLLSPDSRGTPRVAPANEDECALLLGTAYSEGWSVRIEGAQSWIPPDAPAAVVLNTQRLTGIVDVNPADMVVTVRAGTRWDALRTSLANQGTWVPLDPPGLDRSVGSVVACATAGPLRTGFGTTRDQLLGQTLVAADGRVVQTGGRVVKNVAGYDLTKLAAGSFGAFGVITLVHLRTRAVPRADLTAVAGGERDEVLNAARDVMQSGVTPAALEVLSPKASGEAHWVLAARLVGSDVSVRAERDAIAAAVHLEFEQYAASRAARFWETTLAGVTRAATTIRLGALPSSLEQALDAVTHYLDEDRSNWTAVSVPAGVVRWSGTTTAERLRLLRGVAAQLEMPVTLERASWSVRSPLGHFGAYRDGVGRIVHALRSTFDGKGVLTVPLSGAA
jgi:glycolate oxidase FAD binding subunit